MVSLRRGGSPRKIKVLPEERGMDALGWEEGCFVQITGTYCRGRERIKELCFSLGFLLEVSLHCYGYSVREAPRG